MMGMGEPLYNFDAVRDALLIVADNEGIGISPPHHAVDLGRGAEYRPHRRRDRRHAGDLALHAVRDELRNELVPLNRKYPIAEYSGLPRLSGSSNARRITFEYVMLKGVNDSMDDAKLLVKMLRAFRPRSIGFRSTRGLAPRMSARTGSRSRNVPNISSTPATPRRCVRRAAATSSLPAAS
jgi:23S rRNA (adenine2503-C2)-methyltransferase